MAVTYPGLNYNAPSLLGSGISGSQSSSLGNAAGGPGLIGMVPSAAGTPSVSGSAAALGFGTMGGGYMPPTGQSATAATAAVAGLPQAAFGRANSMQTDLQSKAPRPRPSRFVRR